MSSYSLDVTTSFVEGAQNDNIDELDSMLGIIADIHGGIVLDSSDVPSQFAYQRHCVEILDCGNLLYREVEWLRRKFPFTRFTLKEFTST